MWFAIVISVLTLLQGLFHAWAYFKTEDNFHVTGCYIWMAATLIILAGAK